MASQPSSIPLEDAGLPNAPPASPPATVGQKRRAEADDESDWEYEYDENETETHYVTLDLSAFTAPAKSKKPAGNAPRHDEPESKPSQSQDGRREDGDDNNDREPREATSSRMPQDDVEAPNVRDRIQVLGLHTPHPIISYQNRIYQGDWTSTIGTDLLFSKPSSASKDALRSGPGYDLVAASCAKIVGRQVHLVAKEDFRDRRPTQLEYAQAQETGVAEPARPSAVEIPVPPGASQGRRNQARFLERLMKAKQARGETDSVTIFSKRRNTGMGWRSQASERMNANAEETEGSREGTPSQRSQELEIQQYTPSFFAGEDAQPQAEAQTPASETEPRPKGKSGRRPGKQQKNRAIGGLFRDYRPTEGDEPGADIRYHGKLAHEVVASSSLGAASPDDDIQTPQAWDEPVRPTPIDHAGHGKVHTPRVLEGESAIHSRREDQTEGGGDGDGGANDNDYNINDNVPDPGNNNRTGEGDIGNSEIPISDPT
ncbi:MAG: hypothetical protein M1819_000945 [Sarea resinae]|nr:MAG: hypothetical protein M1819_000945 [Sarea resinae]